MVLAGPIEFELAPAGRYTKGVIPPPPGPLLLQAMPESRRYVLARDWVTGRFTVPNGFQTDGASIPRPLWFLIGSPFAPESIKAAVLHDYLYTSPWRVGAWTRGMVDREFRGMLMEGGVPAWRSWLMWAGVRAFGWLFWQG